jgi:hypothetical protein
MFSIGLSAAQYVEEIQSGLYGTSLKRASSQKRVQKCSSGQFSSIYIVNVQRQYMECVYCDVSVMRVAGRLLPSLFSNAFL